MLEKDKQEILDENFFLNKRKNNIKKTKFELDKRRFFILGIILGIIIIVASYFISSYSNVYYVSIEGNDYIKDETIRQLSGVDENDKYLLVNVKKIKDNLIENKFIKDCEVLKLSNNLIKIKVDEYKIVGYLNVDGMNYFLLEDSSMVEMNEDNLYLISDVPLIRGYNKDDAVEVAKGLSKLDEEIISEISEISKYPFSYDKNMMEVIMHDGNYVFVSCNGVYLLDMTSYYAVIADIGSIDKICLYLDEVTNTFQYRGCPWDIKEEPEKIDA